MTRFNFSATPGVGFLSRLKQIDGYTCEFKHYRTHSRPGESKCTKIQDNSEGWDYTVCKDAEEILPDDAPTVNGERMTVNNRLDTNSMNNILSCKACTDTLHLFNGIPSEGSSLKELMLETATYRSEICTAKIYVALIIERRDYIGHVGIHIYEKTPALGDNVAIIYGDKHPFSILLKRHPISTYHNVRPITACNGEYKLYQMDSFCAECNQPIERGAIQASTYMNPDGMCIYINIILFIITRIYSSRSKQVSILSAIVASKQGVMKFRQRMCLNHELRSIQLSLFLIEKCNVKRVSSRYQECMARRGITKVDRLLSDERNECTYSVPYSTEYSEQYCTRKIRTYESRKSHDFRYVSVKARILIF